MIGRLARLESLQAHPSTLLTFHLESVAEWSLHWLWVGRTKPCPHDLSLEAQNIILQAPVVREEEWLQQNMGLARISKIDKTALMQAELMYQDET